MKNFTSIDICGYDWNIWTSIVLLWKHIHEIVHLRIKSNICDLILAKLMTSQTASSVLYVLWL